MSQVRYYPRVPYWRDAEMARRAGVAAPERADKVHLYAQPAAERFEELTPPGTARQLDRGAAVMNQPKSSDSSNDHSSAQRPTRAQWLPRDSGIGRGWSCIET